MAVLTIVASIKAKADKIDLVKAELEKLIDITRAEEGCVQYDLHQDNGDLVRGASGLDSVHPPAQ